MIACARQVKGGQGISQEILPCLRRCGYWLNPSGYISQEYNYRVDRFLAYYLVKSDGNGIIKSLQYNTEELDTCHSLLGNLWKQDKLNGNTLVHLAVSHKLLGVDVSTTFKKYYHNDCQNHVSCFEESLKYPRGTNGSRCFSTIRWRSEELRKNMAEENRKMRDRCEASEREWEARVDMSLLSLEDVEIYEAHKAAITRGRFTYDDPKTDYRVMTRLRHFWRGSCCGNACRHCIYNHENLAEREKSQRVFNSAFWVDAGERPDLKQRLCVDQERGARTPGDTSTRTPGHQGTPPPTPEEFQQTGDDDVDPLLFKH